MSRRQSDKQETPQSSLPPAMRARFEHAVREHRAGRIDQAIAGYQALVADAPDFAPAYANLGAALRKQGRLVLALVCHRRALELAPDTPGFLMNIGNVLKDLDRFDEALTAHRAVVAAQPKEAQGHYNLGITLKESGAIEAALAAFERAQGLDPDNAEIAWDRALALLLLGRFADGWPAYEARWRLGSLRDRGFQAPRWRGEDFTGKTLLLTPEQGFGDAILSSRFVPQVKARGGAVWLECKAPLRRLFSGMAGVDRLVEPGGGEGGFDLQCPAMSLPGLFDAPSAGLPPPSRLHVPAAARRRWAQSLAPAADVFRVGIVWSGSLTFKGNRRRATSLERFLRLAEVPGVRLYSLQKGPLERELENSGARAVIADIGGQVADFAETAAAIEALDLVVMTDSAVAHLAGSLGKPIWNLLSFVPYWLYGMAGETTPWYPAMRLFRQPRPGDWDSVFDRVAKDLGEVVEVKRKDRWPR